MQFILNNLFCLKDFTKGAGLKWNALPTQDKEAYLAEARPKFEEYKVKLKEWETNMVAQGHENVVSKGFRNKLQRSLKNYSVKERLNKARLKKAILVRKQADLTIQASDSDDDDADESDVSSSAFASFVLTLFFFLGLIKLDLILSA